MDAPFYGTIDEVRVMLVDRDKELVTEMVDLLESYEYKVTTVDMTPVAMSILSKEKEKIDVMIINVHSPDSLCFKLLKQAVALDIVSLFVCEEHNELFAKQAFADGAYLYLKKPLDEKIVKYLWQFVLWEKKQREKVREENGDQIINVGNKNIVGDEEQVGQKNNTEKQSNDGESPRSGIIKTVGRKSCLKWTRDLHVKFMKAVEQLGEGRCLPKEILKVMNVPGLTKKHVSSHLQLCRRNNRRAPGERKHILQGSSSGSQQRRSYKKCGRMPRFQTNVPNQNQRGPEFQPNNTSNIIATSTQQQQLHRQQLQVQPHCLNTFLSTQNNAGGGIQQQHSPLLGMLGSEGPTFRSTNYRPDMMFNIGDHHDYGLDHQTPNDYNLDFNGDHIPTYLGSAMMSGTHVGNATINRFGEANANFQQCIGEQNMSSPSNIVVASNFSDIEGSDSKEWENCDTYFNFNNTDDLFQNLGSPSSTLPIDLGGEFDQIHSNDQVAATVSVQCPGIAHFSDKSST